MSSRNIRRLRAEREQKEKDLKKVENKGNAESEEESDQEFTPHVVQSKLAGFQGLEISSDSTSELSVLSDEPEEGASQESASHENAATVIPEEDILGAKKKQYTFAELKQKNKKAKRKNKKRLNKKPYNMDEVEWSLMEVNQMLGSPPERQEPIVEGEKGLEKRVFLIHPYKIDVNYELGKVFAEEDRLNKFRRGNTRRRRHEIGLSPDLPLIKMKGLSMALFKTEGQLKYFRFEHSPDYRTRYKNLLIVMEVLQTNLHPENCVEALLENCDFLYTVEEHKAANTALEQAIYCMQSVGEQSFNFVDGNCRVEYKYIENRPFLIAILKYIYVLTNTACHRTALELAKALINLDPSDPLAVIYVIDTLAIRAREFEWLIDLVNVWRDKRQAHRLFHMRYSVALAMFHVAYKKKDQRGIEAATAALEKAIKYFPSVALRIIKFANANVSPEIIRHDIFYEAAVTQPGVRLPLDYLMDLYAWMIGPRWREPRVWKWLMNTVKDLCSLYDDSIQMRDEIEQGEKLRKNLFRTFPVQIAIHLGVVKPMSKYFAEGHFPPAAPTISFNPYPHRYLGVDQYNYFTNWGLDDIITPPRNGNNAFLSLVGTFVPNIFDHFRCAFLTDELDTSLKHVGPVTAINREEWKKGREVFALQWDSSA